MERSENDKPEQDSTIGAPAAQFTSLSWQALCIFPARAEDTEGEKLEGFVQHAFAKMLTISVYNHGQVFF